jgi:protein SCO1/2
MTNEHGMGRVSRRTFVAGGLAALAAPAVAFGADGALDHGRVKPPLAPPDIEVVSQDGSKARLPALLRGRATALHPMFTACRATCPIQGAIFAQVQKLLPDQAARGIQLVSLSVDPTRDTPVALRKWLQGFHARPGWIAAAPSVEADGATVRTFTGGGRNPADNHSTQVLIFNRDGLLVWRTFDLPEAQEIATILRKV